jgi:D-arabinose 1-dehydrogenase-like Zn-dependent alcohol dehydrogenase
VPRWSISSRSPRSKHYKLTTVPVPQPKGHEALVKIGAAGLCHTDLLVMSGEFGGDNYPITGSHEPAGTVVALGPDARGYVEVGQRVAGLLPLDPCGRSLGIYGAAG